VYTARSLTLRSALPDDDINPSAGMASIRCAIALHVGQAQLASRSATGRMTENEPQVSQR